MATTVDMKENLDMCIEGYDPFPVVFRDMSDVRSFKTKFWKYDFGDSIIFGCDVSSTAASGNTAFMLPGDKDILSQATGRQDEYGAAFKTNVDYFHRVQPKCLMNLDYTQYKNYHSTSGANIHYTGMDFMSSTGSTSGTPTNLPPVEVDGLYRFRRIPKSTIDGGYVEVTGIEDSILEDQCARENCELEYDFGNSIMHIYKGPGIYYATMTCSSDTGLQGMEVSNEIFDPGSVVDKEKIAGCWINVLPVCPCVSGFEVYGTGTNKRFKTITASDFSCDSINGSPAAMPATGLADFNCFVEFQDFDGAMRVTKAVSGYAPFLEAAASGRMIARSLPVTGAWVDWSDWSTDYMVKDETKFGAIVGGWPYWETQDGGRYPTVSGSHVYTLPGLYSVGIAPEFDIERITNYMPTVVGYEDCVESTLRRSASGCCVLVVEIPPSSGSITYNVNSVASGANSHPSIITEVRANFRAGSYPISRIDWDFGDGSEIMTISTEGYKVLGKDVSGNMSPSAKLVDYKNKTTTAVYTTSAAHSVCNGWFVGNGTTVGRKDGEYNRWDCRDYLLSHTYTRTSVDDHPNGYDITCSAYAENTNTCAVHSIHVFPNGAGLPHFDEVEECVEMSDIRSDRTGETNIVLQSQEENRLYVNRAVNTNEDRGSDIDETPAFPIKPKDEDDEPVPGDVVYWFFGDSDEIPGINKVNISFKDEIRPLTRAPVFRGVASDVDGHGKTWYVRLTVTKDLYEGTKKLEDGKKVFEFGVNLDWVFVDQYGSEIEPDVTYHYDPMEKWGKYPQKMKIIVNESEEDGDVVTGTAVIKLLIAEDYDEETDTIIYHTLSNFSRTFIYQKTIIPENNN